jgi:RNA polymerase sigma factor (TIGR02999 family)
MQEPVNSLTVLLEHAAAGDSAANEALFEQIYRVLKKLARSQLNANRRGTICTTELVNETSVRLLGAEYLGSLKNRRHLVAMAAQAMRHILIEHARKRNSQKRGGDWLRLDLDESELFADRLSDQVLALEEAMQKLRSLDQRAHQVVELKFFGGCTTAEIADYLDVSEGTVKIAWRKSRAFLYSEMEASD